jgi:hypothetical protein
VKRLCSDFKKNERGEEEIRQVVALSSLCMHKSFGSLNIKSHENGVYVQIMAKAELHLSMLESELLSRIDLDGSQKQSRKGGMRKSNVRSPSKKTEISAREVATRNETPTPTRQCRTFARHQSRAWEEQAQVIPLNFRVYIVCVFFCEGLSHIDFGKPEYTVRCRVTTLMSHFSSRGRRTTSRNHQN